MDTKLPPFHLVRYGMRIWTSPSLMILKSLSSAAADDIVPFNSAGPWVSSCTDCFYPFHCNYRREETERSKGCETEGTVMEFQSLREEHS
ncbi:hypothetical protein CDL15_Pgr010959 [Punica granatum]|uniref:Uncharacterized protein n=1 Tax=Punica granatum TaxID=22663 RepID=A0A218XLK8_PUNGR|nr:hypothetical protein CDL15_Pgr010959 [Punica granatum]PKI66893.1 hypothetical protein CRG98_012656 [Punica granatum]